MSLTADSWKYELPLPGKVLAHNAHVFPDKVAARDLARALTYREWNARACRLASSDRRHNSSVISLSSRFRRSNAVTGRSL